MNKRLPVSIFIYNNPDELNSPNHQLCRSEGYTFSLIRKASGNLRIGHSSLELTDSVLVNVRPNTAMEWKFNAQPFVSSVLIVRSDDINDPYLSRIFRNYDYIHFSASPIIQLNEEVFYKLDRLITLIEMFQNDSNTVEHLVKGFLAYVVDAFNRPKPWQLGEDSSFQFVNLVKESFAEQKSLSYYADKLKVSTQVLRNRVRLHLNETPNRVIWNISIDKAKELLVYSDSKISEVAFQIGCDDTAYFSRKFKKLTGLSPDNYRKRYKKIQ